jgi:multiple sugar transport system permease protein
MSTTTARPDVPMMVPGRHTTPAQKVVLWAKRGGLTTLAFCVPMLFIFGIFSWYPIVRTFTMAFQKTNFAGASSWVGLANFRWVLTDPDFPRAVLNTGYFALLALIIGFPLPLIGAVLMSEVKKLRGVFTVLAYLPVVIPPVVSVLLWKFFYDGSPTGVFNQLLGYVGMGPYPWLNNAHWAMPSLVLEATWAGAGGTVIIYLAALIGVPRELYEAAEVDGSGIWSKVWNVTLPHLRGILLITFILQIISTAQVFLEPYLFTGGGPNKATLTILLMIYNYAFGGSTSSDYGSATALSLLLAIVLAIFSIIYFRLTKGWSQS